MNEVLKNILNKLKIEEKYFNEFTNGSIACKVNDLKSKVLVVIYNDTNISFELYKLLSDKFKEFFNGIDSRLKIEVKNVNNNYFLDYFNEAINIIKEKNPIIDIFSDRLVEKEDKYFVEVINKAEERQVSDFIKDLNLLMSMFGYNVNITTLLNEEKRNDVLEEIEQSLNIDVSKLTPPPEVKEESVPKNNGGYRKYEKKEVDENTLKGRVIKDNSVPIKSIVGEEDSVTIEGEVFGVDEFEPASKAFKILTLKVSDYTDSIYCKVFIRDDDEFTLIKKNTKSGTWLRVRGSTKIDKYSGGELVLNIRDINKIDSKSSSRSDNSEEKRVELHAHTQMSQMDGITNAKALVKQAKKWGHKAIAITDHDGCQSFPDVYHTICDINKGLEEKDKFKALYGCELTLIEDTVNVILRKDDSVLLDNTYVVFDFETTGFNAGGGDQIIEIGAVKIKNGEIIDRFDELIDPHRKLPAKITEVTSITDSMLQGKDDEETVVKRFIDWYEDLPMVAHNAKFDVSFLEMAHKKYNLGTFTNTVIDTLELSRLLDTGYARHSLSALVKRYEVPWDEEHHHRADYDAEGTALVFHRMMQKLANRDILKVSELDTLINPEEIHKFGRSYHINLLVLNKVGLKNLFKIVSFANTKYFYKGAARILRSVLNEHREGLLIGSGCYESEVFVEARSKSEEELVDVVSFYDYVEVQPPACYDHLLQMNDFANKKEINDQIEKIIRVTKEAGKMIVASGDVHHLNPEDKIYRQIIVNQKVPGGGRHPLARNSITDIPSMHFRTTEEMIKEFSFLDSDLVHEIVIENPNKIADMAEIIEVIIETGGVPFSPLIDKSVETVTDLVYGRANSWYGDVLPYNIEERIATELYGDSVFTSIKDELERENYPEEDREKEGYKRLHEVILKGDVAVKDLVRSYLKRKDEENLSDEDLEKKLKKTLGGVIGGGFDVIYLIAQKLVKHSNDDGYLVGSRGSVGSSFVATMMGITEVNPLPAHYLCRNCKHSIFEIDGKALGSEYSSGYDLPDMTCPVCGSKMGKEGQDMPFATFLGFNADKVPDIDLNFSGDNQASAHAYTKVLFGEDNVYRAGTIGTVADKTAFGFVKGYCEDKGIDMRTAEIERIAIGCTGVKRTTGQHPGGIVVIPGYMDVYDFTPYQYPAGDVEAEWRTTHFDYHAIDQDVLKLDILGHDDPTILRMLQDLSGIDVTTLPMDDKKVISLLSSCEALGVTEDEIMCPTGTLGLPELGTKFVINMLVETKPKTFAELVKISGLSHGTDVWAGNASELIKNNVVPFKEVIGCRDDIMVYLMYNGLRPIDAFKIMEFVRKGKATKDPENWKKWETLMREKNIPEWYIESCHKIKYMFPKAHAVAYVMSAIRIAWFKVYKPIFYYAAFFSIRSDDFDIETMIKGYDAIRSKMEDLKLKGYDATNKETNVLSTLEIALEATARGISFEPINLYKSDAKYFVLNEDKTKLIPPFRAIDGLGDTVAKTIVEERENREFISIEDLQKRGKVSQTLIEKMRLMHMLDDLPESSQLSLF